MLNKSDIIMLLSENIKTVTFTKADGSERIMKCTLMEEYIPQQTDVEEYISRKKNDNICVVWDVEKEGWRSFRLDSVKGIH